MSALLDRAVEYFVAPESLAARPGRWNSDGAHAAPRPPAAAGVLGAVEDVPPVAALLAAHLRVRARVGCAVLARLSGEPPRPLRGGQASRGARRLAERLEGRGLETVARGRSVTVDLPTDPDAAAGAWHRTVAAADCPSVLALAGPRPPGLDPLLADLDLLVLVLGSTAPAELADLALAGMVQGRALVAAAPPVPAGVARCLMSSSLATTRLLGPEVNRAVRTLS